MGLRRNGQLCFSSRPGGEAAPFCRVERRIDSIGVAHQRRDAGARLRQTTDSDGDRAYQLIRPLRLVKEAETEPWSLLPYLAGLTPQRNVVMLKAAVAAVLEPEARILQPIHVPPIRNAHLQRRRWNA